MNKILLTDTSDLVRGLRWLMFFRIVFATIMAFSTLIYCAGENLSYSHHPFVVLYAMSLLILFLSLAYALILPRIKAPALFAYGQLIVDSFFITIIIFVTGSSESIFTFLYLVGIIGTSMLLLRRGSMIIASFCSVQYALLVSFEYYGMFESLGGPGGGAFLAGLPQIVYRVVIIASACFAVAFLSGILALQARLARRDLKVVERHLKRVERMAVVGDLVASMAHEIKNPLASISGSIQLLSENTKPGSSDLRLMQIVLRETKRLSTIVTDFLLFATPKVGVVQDIRLDSAVDEVVALFKQDPLCSGRIEIFTRIDATVWITMDPGHLKQVLWNLLKNSAEAIDTVGVISIRLSKFNSGSVRLTIADNGCGIKSDDLESVFDPFFTTKRSGTGLGLSIVHRIIDSYQGVIDLETEPGKGTVFTLILKGRSSTKS